MNNFNTPLIYHYTRLWVFAIEIDFCYNAEALKKEKEFKAKKRRKK
jgi:hypothetical protein